jgi:chorismate synthase
MNSFGRLFRVSVFGESHGREIGILIDGCPAGLPLAADDLLPDLERRQARAVGTTPRREPDIPVLKSGILNDLTTGAPLLISFENQDARPQDYQALQDTPRPGHADFTARCKFKGFNDPRGGGHFSGRLTVGLVAAGAIAKKLLSLVSIEAFLLEAGGSRDIAETVQQAMQEDDSIGGLIECRIRHLPIGLGEPFFDSLESLISHAIFAIPGVRGIEFGSGFESTRMKGSQANDSLIDAEGRTQTNFAGGINGGLSNGNELVFRVAVKPTSSITRPQHTMDLKTGNPAVVSIQGRHDTCFALRIPVVVEAAAALVLADLYLLEQKMPKVGEKTHGT